MMRELTDLMSRPTAANSVEWALRSLESPAAVAAQELGAP